MADEITADSVDADNQTAEAGTEDLLTQGESVQEQTEAAASSGENTDDTQAASDEQQAPEEYGPFDLPDGMEIDEQTLALANPVFKELGLSQEQAQKLVDLEAARVQAQLDQFQQQVATWQNEVKSDPEIGGEKMDESIALANKALETYFEPGFLDALRAVGYTNHPEVIRGLKRIAERHLAEDNPGGGRAPSKEKSRIDRFYGTEN